MKNAYRLFVVATVAAGAVLPLAAREAVLSAESDTYEYRIDTTPSPHAVKTQEELAGLMEATYFAGETVTATLSGGAASTLVAASIGEVWLAICGFSAVGTELFVRVCAAALLAVPVGAALFAFLPWLCRHIGLEDAE